MPSCRSLKGNLSFEKLVVYAFQGLEQKVTSLINPETDIRRFGRSPKRFQLVVQHET